MGPVLHFKAPEQFFTIITAITLAFVAYTVGLSFSSTFLKKSGREILTILVVEVLMTSIVVGIFIYLLTKDAALSIIAASLAPATAPAGTVAVLRDLRAKGELTDACIAIVGLDDAAAIIIYCFGLVCTKMLLGSKVGFASWVYYPVWQIFGAVALGGIIGLFLSYLAKKIHLSSDHVFVICVAVAILAWGLAEIVGVSAILTCMILGTTVINFNVHVGHRSGELIDNIMTPIFILFFAAIGMKIDFSQFASMWTFVIMYCIGRSVGKIIGSAAGSLLSKSEPKITKYLGVALLNQAGVAVGLAFLAAQQLSEYNLGTIIITLMATTTALFQIVAPIFTQYAVRKAGESNV